MTNYGTQPLGMLGTRYLRWNLKKYTYTWQHRVQNKIYKAERTLSVVLLSESKIPAHINPLPPSDAVREQKKIF